MGVAGCSLWSWLFVWCFAGRGREWERQRPARSLEEGGSAAVLQPIEGGGVGGPGVSASIARPNRLTGLG
jgi:hypothetical protein